MTIESKYSDAGRSNSLYNEKNDCTVRAYALAANIEYKQAHANMFLAGRKCRRGFAIDKFYTEEFGKPLPRPNMTVKNYVMYIAHTGRWIIEIRGHVFAVIDGVIHDEPNPDSNNERHVLQAWKCS
jgi:hypothetical protein